MTIHIGHAREASALKSPKRPSHTALDKKRASLFALVIPSPILRAAAERVAAGCRNDIGDAASEPEARAVLVALAQVVHDHRSGRGPISRHLPPRPWVVTS